MNQEERGGKKAGVRRFRGVRRVATMGMVAAAAAALHGCVADEAEGTTAGVLAPSAVEGPEESGDVPASTASVRSAPDSDRSKPFSAADPDTLRGAVVAGLNYSAAVKGGIAQVAEAGTNVSIAQSGYLPTLESSAGFSDTSQHDYRISISQPLFDWGLTGAKVDKARAGVAAAKAGLQAQREETALAAASAFIEVKRRERLAAAADDNVDVHSRIARLARDRHNGGVGDSSEVELARVRLGEAQSALQEELGALRSARSAYYAQVGHNPGKLARVPTLALKASAIADLDAAVAKAPGVIAAVAREEAARHVVDAEKASLLPKVSVQGYVRDDGDSRGQYTGVGLRVSGPTITGLSNFQRVGAARLAAESARWKAESVKREAIRKVREFIDRAPTLKSKIAILAQQIRQARALRDVYEDQFKVGQRSLIDLVNVQADINRITRSRINARYDNILLQYRASAALGRLQQELGLALQGDRHGE